MACDAAVSGRLRHPQGANKGCGKAEGVGGIWEQIAWQPATRVVSGMWSWAEGTAGLPVLLVLPRRSRLHQGGTDSAAFPRESGQQDCVCRLIRTPSSLFPLQESSCSTWCAVMSG